MRRPRRAGVVALAVAAAIAAVSLAAIAPPYPRDATAQKSEFSAERAMAHLRELAAAPRPVGGLAHQRARDHLLTTLREYGLTAKVQESVGVDPSPRRAPTAASVENVVGVLPGSRSTGRLFLMAHYDSVAAGPGASDDGAGVAALLETARALASGPRMRNDVVFVFTDAEETCLCGAEAFVREHPLARDGGVVLNLEARGSSGAVVMFETTPGNAQLVEVFAEWAPYPLATSAAGEVYRRLPNDTDLTAFQPANAGAVSSDVESAGPREDGSRSRFAGLNSAYLDGSAAYHTPLDTLDAVDPASVQHHGANALALARGFGGADLRQIRADSDAIYFPVFGALARYPAGLAWPLALLAAAAVVALAVFARRLGLASLPRVALGAGLAGFALLGAGVVATALWLGVVALWPEQGAFRVGDPHQPGPYRMAVLAVTGVVLIGWHWAARKIVMIRAGGGAPAALAIGALVWPTAIGVATAAVMPGASYLGSLPALAAGCGGVAALALRRRPVLAVAALTVASAVSVVVYAPMAALLFPSLGLPAAGASAVVATLAVFGLLPLVELALGGALLTDGANPARDGDSLREDAAASSGRGGWALRRPAALSAAVAALLTVSLAAVGLQANQVSPERPRPTHLLYALDADTGEASWFSADVHPGPWTRRYVTQPARAPERFPLLGSQQLRVGRAPAATLAAPELTVLSDRTRGDLRTVVVRMRSARGAPISGLYVDRKARVLRATVAGRSAPVDRVEAVGRWGFGLGYAAPPPEGVTVRLTVREAGPLRVRVVDESQGLASLPGFVPRPAHLSTAPGHHTDATLVARTYTI